MGAAGTHGRTAVDVETQMDDAHVGGGYHGGGGRKIFVLGWGQGQGGCWCLENRGAGIRINATTVT